MPRLPDSLRKKSLKRVTWPLRLQAAHRDALNLLAEEHDVNASDLVRHAITLLPGWDKALKRVEKGS